ncbi:MAG: DUF2800 domain-containing protein [Lachnospiraceae bacterium]|nr:DUF2800 domain-containing protein [Lachnospiraceae bacterium]
MIFNKHSNLEGKHALLGASRWQWINDDEDGLVKRMRSMYAPDIGTILHAVAAKRIKHRFRLSKADKKSVLLELIDSGIPRVVINALDFDAMYENLMAYVNDAITFKMIPEQLLYYSDYCFGTADAISFSEKEHFLRIHDYKSGTLPVHMEQLMVYEALFCHEYHFKPYEIQSELRIYKGNEVLYHKPTPDQIAPIMDQMVTQTKFLKSVND